jgi:hypothetical protein
MFGFVPAASIVSSLQLMGTALADHETSRSRCLLGCGTFALLWSPDFSQRVRASTMFNKLFAQ